MSKVLVTGGAGYIGAHVALLLQENGYKVRIFDDLSNGQKNRIDNKFKDIVIADILDRNALIRACDGVNAVIHLAAKKAVGESIVNPLKYYQNNVGGVLNLLLAMRVNGVKKIVFSSSASVYAETESLCIAEDSLKEPLSPYGQTKLLSEQLISIISRAENFSSISLRYFNVVGASREEFADNSQDNLVPKVLAALKTGKRPEIFGSDYPTKDGTCIRDYIHIADLAEAHLLALDRVHTASVDDVFNIGSGIGYSVIEVIEQIAKSLNLSIDPLFSPRRTGDPVRLVASISKIERELGWKPKRGLQAMIDSACRAEAGVSP